MNTVYRKELKYRIPRQRAYALQAKLSQIMQRDKNGAGGSYFIRSQYYDSLYDQDLADNLDGVYEKSKLRLRIYSTDAATVKLEYKCKFGSDGVKHSLPISREQALQMEQGDVSFLLSFRQELALRLYLRMTEGIYRPKALIDYSRLAFTYPPGDVRITFDTEISGVGYPYGLFEPMDADPLSDAETVLMEVKYTGFLPEQIRKILTEADESASGNSKYSAARMHYL